MNSTDAFNKTTLAYATRPMELFLALFVVVDTVTIVGNILVILTIYFNKNMRNTIYILLLNLSITDLLFGILAPVHVHNMLTGEWTFGEGMCKGFYFTFRMLYAFSVMLLELITCERFLAVLYPLFYKPRPRRTMGIIVVLCICSIILTSPFLVVEKTFFEEGKWYCYQDWEGQEYGRSVYYMIIFLFLYAIPLLVMSVMYSFIAYRLSGRAGKRLASTSIRKSRPMASRRRMSKLVMMVVLGFFLCWTPWNIAEFLELQVLGWTERIDELKFYSMILVFTSSAINVFLYSFLSLEFRNGFRAVFGNLFKSCGYKKEPVTTQPVTCKSTVKFTSRPTAGEINV